MIKLHSLPGPDVIEWDPMAPRPDDFLRPEVRDFIAAVNGPKWVKVWISWFRVQGSFPKPTDLWSSWAQLRSAGNEFGKYFERLDVLIKAINNAGYGAILQVDHNHPRWSVTAARSTDPSDIPRERYFPESVEADSPWGWWMTYLLCRYRMGVPVNANGPTQQNVYGNKEGAALYGLEFCNEPNLLNAPVGDASCYVAEMFVTMEFLAAYHWPYSGTYGGIILGPSTADGDTGDVRNWDPFMKVLLDALPVGWNPRVYIGWSHHNYEDIDDTLLGGTGSARLEGVRRRLLGGSQNDTNNPWRNGDRNVYLTEGAPRRTIVGENPGDLTSQQELEQVTMTQRAFARVKSLNSATGGAYPVYAQHQLNDVPWSRVKYAPRRNWKLAEWARGDDRKLAATWKAL